MKISENFKLNSHFLILIHRRADSHDERCCKTVLGIVTLEKFFSVVTTPILISVRCSLSEIDVFVKSLKGTENISDVFDGLVEQVVSSSFGTVFHTVMFAKASPTLSFE